MRFGVFKGDDDYYFYTTLYIYVRGVECLLGKKENHKEDHLACDECYPALKEKITDIYQSYCNKDNDFKNFDNVIKTDNAVTGRGTTFESHPDFFTIFSGK